MTTTWQEGIPDYPCNCERCRESAASAGYADNLRQAAFDAANGEDWADWELLEGNCPGGVKLGDFIDKLMEPKA